MNHLKNQIKTLVNNYGDSVLGAQKNNYYSIEFTEHICELSKNFSCWTNVMYPFFQNDKEIASSSYSETYFGQLKKSLNS